MQDRLFFPTDRIDPHDPDITAAWCRQLGCSVIELRDAMARVGPRFEALRRAVRRPALRR